MFRRIFSLVSKRETPSNLLLDHDDDDSSSLASFKDAAEDSEDLASTYRCAIYRLNGIEADLIFPSADLRLVENGIINEDEDSDAPSWQHEALLSIRQNIPESIQFVETPSTSTTREWGLHFSNPRSARRFRNELMNGIAKTCCDLLARSVLRFQRDYSEEEKLGVARILQRESDSLTLLVITEIKTATNFHNDAAAATAAANESELIVELTRDLHLEIRDVEKGEVVIWGPYENCNPWRRVWWFLKGLSEKILLVMTHSFGIEEKILKPISPNFDDDQITEDENTSFTFGEIKILDQPPRDHKQPAEQVPAAGDAPEGGDAPGGGDASAGDDAPKGGAAPGTTCGGGVTTTFTAAGSDRWSSGREESEDEWVADLNEECYGPGLVEGLHPVGGKGVESRDHKFMEVGRDHSFVCRAKGVKSQWWNGQNRERDYELHVMNVAGDEERFYEQVIGGDKFTYNSKAVNPTRALIPGYDDSRMMFVDGENDPRAVYHFDIEKEKVVSKYDTGGLKADLIWRTLKGEQTGQTFMAASSDSFYLMDTRQQNANVRQSHSATDGLLLNQTAGGGGGGGRGGGGGGAALSSPPSWGDHGLSARSYTRQYKTHTNFTAAASDASGHIAIGNRTGVIRLYDGAPNDSGEFKIAKTQLDAKQDVIKSIDTLQDGSWIVATMKECLVLYPTKMKNSEKTGFEMRLGSNKPDPLYLTLEPKDIRKYKLDDIDFRPAIFSENQDCIITSTGNLAIIWDLAALRKGKLNRAYTIKQTDLVIQETKATADGKVLLAHPQRVEILSTNRK